MQKIKNNLSKNLIYFFVLIQILFDFLRTTEFVNIEVFNLSILELINTTFIILIFLITIFKNPHNIKKYILYFIVLIIYLGLHYYNTTLFNLSAYKNQNPNFLIESYHILITYGIPLLMLFSIMNTKVKKEDILKLLNYLALGISLVIIILNVFKLAKVAYGDGQVKYSIFNWFTYNGGNYEELTSKGWFFSTNQISAILFTLFPLTILSLLNEKKIINYVIAILQVIAMYMLGTKVATLGMFLSLVAIILINIFVPLIKGDKIEFKKNYPILIIFLLALLIFPISPLGYKYLKMETNKESIELTPDLEKITKLNCDSKQVINEEKDFIKEMVTKYQVEAHIPSYILNSYPVEYDYQYWCRFFQREEFPINDFRVMKNNILQSIYSRNNNKLDKYLGMGYSLGFTYNEQDYYYQFYIYGILGILVLVGPFYLISILGGILILKNFKLKLNVTNVTILMTPFMGLLVGFMSGHVLERTFPMIVVAIVTGLSYRYITETKKNA